MTRKDIDELQAFAKEWGGKGLAHLIVEPSGELRSPIAKFLSEAEVAAILEATGAEPGSVVFLAADSEAIVNRVLGALRSHLAERFDLIDRDAWRFLYVVDFPLFKQDEETGGWAAEHHMFTAPVRVHEDLIESDPGAVLSRGVRHGAERHRDGLGIDQDQPSRPAAARVRRDRLRTRRTPRSGSASSCARCASARRRTGAWLPASTAR